MAKAAKGRKVASGFPVRLAILALLVLLGWQVWRMQDQLTAAILQGKQQATTAQTAEGAASGGGTAVKQTAMERMRQQTHEAVRPR